MKNLIVSILLLSALTYYFSIYGERVAYNYPREGWAFFGGESGTPTPQDGAEGQMDAFVFSATQETTADQTAAELTEQSAEPFPVTVTVDQQKETTPQWEYMLHGVAATLVVEVIVLLCITVIYWIKCRPPKIKRK